MAVWGGSDSTDRLFLSDRRVATFLSDCNIDDLCVGYTVDLDVKIESFEKEKVEERDDEEHFKKRRVLSYERNSYGIRCVYSRYIPTQLYIYAGLCALYRPGSND